MPIYRAPSDLQKFQFTVGLLMPISTCSVRLAEIPIYCGFADADFNVLRQTYRHFLVVNWNVLKAPQAKKSYFLVVNWNFLKGNLHVEPNLWNRPHAEMTFNLPCPKRTGYLRGHGTVGAEIAPTTFTCRLAGLRFPGKHQGAVNRYFVMLYALACYLCDVSGNIILFLKIKTTY